MVYLKKKNGKSTLAVVQTPNKIWLTNTSILDMRSREEFYKVWDIEWDWWVHLDQIKLKSPTPYNLPFNKLKDCRITGNIGWNISESGTMQFDAEGASTTEASLSALVHLLKQDHLDWCEERVLLGCEVMEWQSKYMEEATAKMDLKLEKQQLKRAKNDYEDFFITDFNTDLMKKNISTSRASTILLYKKWPMRMAQKFFIGYNGKKMAAHESPVTIVHPSETKWTTKERFHGGIGRCPMSFAMQVYNGGQTYETYCEQRGLWFTFTNPNFTYQRNTMTLTFEAIRRCATNANKAQNIWQRIV